MESALAVAATVEGCIGFALPAGFIIDVGLLRVKGRVRSCGRMIAF